LAHPISRDFLVTSGFWPVKFTLVRSFGIGLNGARSPGAETLLELSFLAQRNLLNRSTPNSMKPDRLRQQVRQRLQELNALCIFTYQLNDENTQAFLGAVHEVGRASTKRLAQIGFMADSYIRMLSQRFGFVGDLSTLVQHVKHADRIAPTILTMPKWSLEELFTNYASGFPGWQKLPPHTVIPIDRSGHLDKVMWHGIYFPEATLYEDMCAAFNQAARSKELRFQSTATKIQIKTHDMAVRTTILSAYYFVESFLNAIAFDHWHIHKQTLSEEEKDYLLEWDSSRKRTRWLTFEEKTKRYPKIILGVQHPPLVAANCSELEHLLTKGKKIRDAIVHSSPKVDPATGKLDKITHVLGVQIADATAIVDAAIGYVRKLNHVLGPHGTDLDWLIDRDGFGTFPDAAFG
jgi:hypothetical protein